MGRFSEFVRNVFRLPELLEKERQVSQLQKRLEDHHRRSYDVLVASAEYVLKLNTQHNELVKELTSTIYALQEELDRQTQASNQTQPRLEVIQKGVG